MSLPSVLGSDTLLALGRGLSAQLLPHFGRLLSRLVKRAAVVDYIVGGFDFFFVWELCRHAAGDFFAGCFHVDFLACGETRYFLLVGAGDDDQAGEAVRGMGLEDQRRFYNCHGVRILTTHFFHPAFLASEASSGAR